MNPVTCCGDKSPSKARRQYHVPTQATSIHGTRIWPY